MAQQAKNAAKAGSIKCIESVIFPPDAQASGSMFRQEAG
jgi:hypothetical protein